jgi:hypothetical protein
MDDGIAGHIDTLTDTKGCVIITPSVEVAIRTWSRASLQHYYTLPLVVARNNTACWQLVGNRHKVVWALSPHDFAAIGLAAATDSYLLISDPKHHGIEDYIARLDIARLHRRATVDKRIWTAAVAGILRNLNHYDAVDYLSRINLSEDELVRLRDDEPAATSKVIESLLSKQTEFCSVAYRHGFIEQNDKGWFYVTSRRREMIANASTRINKITTYGDKQVASVTSHCDGKSLKFQVDYTELKRDFADILSAKWMAKGRVFISANHWRGGLHQLSLQLHHPTANVGVRHIGFQAKHKNWVTPTHFIRPGRIVQRKDVPEWLKLPGQLYPHWKLWRSTIANSPPVLAASVLLAFQQLAMDYQGLPRQAVLFSGAASLSATNALSAALSAANEYNPDVHNWIVIPRKQFVSGQLPKSSDIAKITAATGWMHTSDMQRWYGLFSGSHSLSDHSPGFVYDRDNYGYLSAFLLHLLKHWRVDIPPMTFGLSVLSKFASTEYVAAVNKTILTDVDPVLSLIMLLKEINVNMHSVFAVNDKAKNTGLVRISESGNDMFIPIAILQQAIRKLRLGYFEHVKILQRLAMSRYFHGFTTQGVDQGWLVDKSFFEKTIKNETLEIRKFSLRLVV